MPNSFEPVQLPRRGRLRPTAHMVSGPDVLAPHLRRARWAVCHLRADRARYGHSGPAARAARRHTAALLIGAVIVLAIAGAPF